MSLLGAKQTHESERFEDLSRDSFLYFDAPHNQHDHDKAYISLFYENWITHQQWMFTGSTDPNFWQSSDCRKIGSADPNVSHGNGPAK